MTIVAQYLRKLSVLVGPAGGAGLDFGEFKVAFRVERGDVQTPNSCDVRIFNVRDDVASQISTKEFNTLRVQAGYGGNFGLIFQGEIKQVRIGRSDAKDSYVDITAADGDSAYNYAFSAFTLAKSSTQEDGLKGFLQDMARHAITPGYAPRPPTNPRIRGRTYYGMTRDQLRQYAKANNMIWSLQDSKLTMVPRQSYIPGNAVLISPQTGLIGVPEQTQNGIETRVLLNPQIKIGQLVKLQSTNVNQLRYGLDSQAQADNIRLALSVKTASDGLYYVMWTTHSGDTRSQAPWYSDLVLLAVDATVPQSAVVKQTTTGPNSVVAIRLD